ncbi:MAG: methyltransferase domain-containing protein [Myxococcota bacterium]
MPKEAMNPETAVRERYSRAARDPEAALCCPTRYDPKLLQVIPGEVLERDYGCGDPTAHLGPGDVVLDLGSGSGKHCFMASQVVGPTGHVIGIDANDDMLALARRHAPTVAERIGYANVEVRKARIQDLTLDLERLDERLRQRPVTCAVELEELEAMVERWRREEPLVPDGAVTAVISNCVLNLVRPEDKRRLFAEIARVLGEGGRAIVSDIVSDQEVPEHLQRDPELWSGCISGAFEERAFLRAFEDAGFSDVEVVERQAEPWREVEGIAFRSVTVLARKGSGASGCGPSRAGGCC